MNCPFLSINYEEFDPSTYKSVSVLIDNNPHCFVGEPVDAMQAAINFCKELGYKTILFSSSVDNFIMDGGNLKFEDKEETNEPSV